MSILFFGTNSAFTSMPVVMLLSVSWKKALYVFSLRGIQNQNTSGGKKGRNKTFHITWSAEEKKAVFKYLGEVDRKQTGS